MAIFRECKHSFRIVQALFGKSASTLVFSATSGSSSANLRNPFRTVRTMFAATNAAIKRERYDARISTAEREQGRCDSSKVNTFR